MKLIKTLVYVAGVLIILAVCGRFLQLRDPNGPRVPIPTEAPGLPHISVSKK